MDREQTKELLPVMTAYAEGREIQYSDNDGTWLCAVFPTWSVHLEYRIKPEPAEAWLYPGLADAWIGKPPTKADIIEHHLRKFREVTDG